MNKIVESARRVTAKIKTRRTFYLCAGEKTAIDNVIMRISNLWDPDGPVLTSDKHLS